MSKSQLAETIGLERETLYKAARGKSERYLKDERELTEYLIEMGMRQFGKFAEGANAPQMQQFGRFARTRQQIHR